jgi:hypothetical protein
MTPVELPIVVTFSAVAMFDFPIQVTYFKAGSSDLHPNLVGGDVRSQAMGEANEGAFDQVEAEESAGEGHDPVERKGLEGAQAGGVGPEMGDEEELLPEVEAV